MNTNIKVAVGLSGGVDSSVAAALLLEKGYEVVGLSMAIYDETLHLPVTASNACFGPEERHDLELTEKICDKLGIPFHVIDLKNEYKKFVLDYFRKEYLSGRTPNPCIVCNRLLKFDFLINRARDAGIKFDYFATGHYAIVAKKGTRFLLKRAADKSKDQSYFLYRLSQQQLSQVLFPVGAYTKQEIRKIAAEKLLGVSEKPESQDFLSRGEYAVLFSQDQIRPGIIVNKEGRKLGMHKGIINYTIGQRRGLGISSPRPLYVLKIEPHANKIVVGEKQDLLCKGLIASNINLIAVPKLAGPVRVTAKIRFKHEGAEATVTPINQKKLEVIFDIPQKAVTPGQSVVLYQGDVVLGGGIIQEPIPLK